ncbi:hypothetical protein QFZ24_003090 [Streptomyces phaeochromogenes]|nr:hypothetical protein [Streptomyces phaeochromogenes]MDQ0949167.1 hypothetical protein [Streptomyces phaeochromogenes]
MFDFDVKRTTRFDESVSRAVPPGCFQRRTGSAPVRYEASRGSR